MTKTHTFHFTESLATVIILLSFLVNTAFAKESDVVNLVDLKQSNKSLSDHTVDYLEDRQGISILDYTGNYDKDVNGVYNAEARQAVLQEFYRNQEDDYDFIYIFTEFEFDTGPLVAFASTIMNDVNGIGKPIYDHRSSFFSEKLQTIIDMAPMSRKNFNVSQLQYDELLDTMMHETMHRWGISVKYLDNNGMVSDRLLGEANAHWSYYLNSNASVMYGSLWQENTANQFKTIDRMHGLSPLDLYLAGFISSEMVQDTFLINNSNTGSNSDLPPIIGTEIMGDKELISVNDIIAYEGERIPSSEDAQHIFKVKFILLKSPDEEIKPESIANLYILQNEFQKRFLAETNGVAQIEFQRVNDGLAVNDPSILDYNTNLENSFDLQSAVSFIITHQTNDWWQDRDSTKVRDTVTVIKALQLILDSYPEVQEKLSTAISWLNNYQPQNNDEMAWMLYSNVLNNGKKQELIESIYANQNPNGGWGLSDKTKASPYDTALVIDGLFQALGSNLNLDTPTTQFVINNINLDSGFSFVAGGQSNVLASSLLLQSINQISNDSQHLTDLTGFILSQQLPDNSFGAGGIGTPHETAFVIKALESLQDNNYINQINSAKLALDGMQSVDGSMQGSLYSAALAINVFNTNTKANLYFNSVSLSNNNVIAGEQISIDFEAANSGAVDANNIEVTAYKDVVDINNQLGQMTINSLSPNQTEFNKIVIDTTNFNPTTEVIIVIDSNDSIDENNEDDNIYSITLTVEQVSNTPELAFNGGDFIVNPIQFDVLPFALNASATVTNLSLGDIDNVMLNLSKLEPNGELTLLQSQMQNIASLGSQEYNFSLDITEGSTDIPLVFSIDPENTITEVNESNNSYQTTIHRIQSIDLVITNENVTLPIQPIVGETQDISFNFTNDGTVLSSGFDVRVYAEQNSNIILLHQSHINELEGGEQLSRNLTWLPLELGTYNIRFVLDEANELAEEDETNNEVILPIQVSANSLTNLNITENDIIMLPDPGLEGQNLQFSISVNNNSNIDSGSFDVNLSKKNSAGIPNTLLITQNVASVAANSSQTINLELQETDLHGEAELIFSVDPNNSIEEFSETDNLVIKQFRVFSKADASISAGSFQFNPSTPVLGELLTVDVNISNSGEQNLEQLEASLYYDNSQQSSPVLVETQNIPLLLGGATQTNTFTFVLPNNSQIDTFTVKLDEADNINEGNESNNEASVLIGTQDQTLYVTQRYFSPNGDGIKDQTSIVFNTETVGNYLIEIIDDRNKLIKSFDSHLFENTSYGDVIWDGRNNKGILARDGDYRVNLLNENSSILKTKITTLDTNRSSLFKSIIENNGYNTELNIIESYKQTNAKLSHDGNYMYVTEYNDIQGQIHKGLFALNADGSSVDSVVPESLFDNADYITFAILDDGNILMTFLQNDSYKMYLKNIETGDNDQIFDYPEYIGSAQEIYGYSSEYAIVKGGYGSYLKVYFDNTIPNETVSGLDESIVEHVLQNGLIVSQEVFGDFRKAVEFGGFLGSQYNLYFVSFDFTFTPQQIANEINEDEYMSMSRRGNVSVDGRNFVYRLAENIQVYQTENNNLVTTFNKSIGVNNNYGFNSHNELYVLNQDEQTVSIYNELGNAVITTQASLQVDDFDSYLNGITQVELSLENGYTFTVNIADILDSKLQQKVISYTDYSDEKELVLLVKSSLVGKFETPACDDNDIPCFDWNPVTEGSVVELSRLVKINYQDLSEALLQTSDLGIFQPLIFSDIQEGRSRYIKIENNEFIDRDSLTISPISNQIELVNPVNPASKRTEILKLSNTNNSYLFYSRNNLYANIWLSIQESAIKIIATTFDWNFDKYEVYWSLSTNPESWNFIYSSNEIPDDQSTVFNWIPNKSGQYNIKFTAYDKSGNTKTSIKKITISNVDSPIRNVTVEPQYFSPNGDNKKDFVDIQFDADASHILIKISDGEGDVVRIYEREYQNSNEHEFIQWDGKNLAGEILPDGKYTVNVQGIETEVNLDTTPITPFDIIYEDNPILRIRFATILSEVTFWLDSLTTYDVSSLLKLVFNDFSSLKMQVFTESTGQWQDSNSKFISLQVEDLNKSENNAPRRYIVEDKAGNVSILPTSIDLKTYPITQLLKVTDTNKFYSTNIYLPVEKNLTIEGSFPSPKNSPEIVDWSNGNKIAYVIQAKSYKEFDNVVFSINYKNDLNETITETKDINLLNPSEALKYQENSKIGGNIFLGTNNYNSNFIDLQIELSEHQFQVPAFLIELEKEDFPNVNGLINVTFEGKNSLTNETIFKTRKTQIKFNRDPQLKNINFNQEEDLRGLPVNASIGYERMLNNITQDPSLDYYIVYEYESNVYEDESLLTVNPNEIPFAISKHYEPTFVDLGVDYTFRLFTLPRSRCQDNLEIVWLGKDANVIKAESNRLKTSRCVDIEIASYLGEFCDRNPHNENEFTFSVFASQVDPLLEPPVLVEVYVERLESLLPTHVPELIFSDTNPTFSENSDLSLEYYIKFDFDIASVINPAVDFKIYAIMTDLNGNKEKSHPFLMAYNQYFQDHELNLPTPSTLYCANNEMASDGQIENNIIIGVDVDISDDLASEEPPLISYAASGFVMLNGGTQVLEAEDANEHLIHQEYIPILERNIGNDEVPASATNRYYSQETGYFNRIIHGILDSNIVKNYKFKDIPEYDGPATFIFETVNNSGRNYCSSVDIEIDNLINIDVIYQLPDVAKGVISPNGDGRQDNILLSTIQAFEQIDITAELYQSGMFLGDIINQDLIANEIDDLLWDGKLNNTVVDDGQYEIKIILEDACGHQHSFTVKVRVDTQSPNSVFIHPLDAEILKPVNRVLIEVDEESTREVEYLYNGVWNSIEILSENYNEISDLYEVELIWNLTNHPINTYPIRITAEDMAGNISTTQIAPILDEVNTIFWNYSLSPFYISPNGDGNKDNLTIDVGLNVDSNITLNILDVNLNLVKTLSIDQAFTAGSHQMHWNGMNDVNNIVQDGNYSIEIIAKEIANPANVETLNLSMTIDNKVPNIQWIRPDASIFKGEGTARISLQEVNPVSFEVSNQRLNPLGEIEQVLNVNSTGNFDLFDLNSLDESQYQLTAKAIDQAGNMKTKSLSYQIDKTPPQIDLLAPMNDDIVGGSNNVLNISGQIHETNFDHYEIAIAVSSESPQWQMIHTETELSEENFTLDWHITVNDGNYKLRILAEDQAGWITETIKDITIDTTPPVAIITNPINDQVVTQATDFIGSANDDNFDAYTLYYKLVTTDNWQVMNIGQDIVNDGILGHFPNGVTGGLYNIKLTVTDLVGLKNEAQTTIELDTQAPPVPLNLSLEVINKQVALQWDAVSSNDFAGYLLYRNGEIITQSGYTNNQYLDTTVTDGEFIYTVTSIDSIGNESEHSNEVMVTIDTIPPDVRIIAPNEGQTVHNSIEIIGTALSLLDFNEYKLYYRESTQATPGTLINQSPIPVTNSALGTLDTTGLNQNSQYIIRLEASDNSDNIAVVENSIFIDNLAPAAPQNLTLTLQGQADVLLNWSANTETDLAGYLVFRNGIVISGDGSGQTVIGNAITQTNYTDLNLVDGLHSFTIAAIDQTGNISQFSNTVEQMINRRPPDTMIVTPIPAQKFEQPLLFEANSNDLDITEIKFEYSLDNVNWNVLGIDLTAPYQVTINPTSLALDFGDIYLRATAKDTAAQEDATPATVTVQYADLTAPAAILNISATIIGGEITLNWDTNNETDLSGYLVYRKELDNSSTLLTTPAIANSTLTLSNLLDGNYSYQVSAIDNANNESDPVNIEDLTVFSIILKQPFSPLLTPEELVISGQSPQTNGTVKASLNNNNGNMVLADILVDNQGNYASSPFSLVSGLNSLVVTHQLSPQNISKESATQVQLSPLPLTPLNFQVNQSGFTNALSWQAPDANTFAYLPYKNGLPIFPIAQLTEVLSYTASSNTTSAENIGNDDPNLYWSPTQTDLTDNTETYIEISFDQLRWIESINLIWKEENNKIYVPNHYIIQYNSPVGWIDISEYQTNNAALASASTPTPYLTDKIRLVIKDNAGDVQNINLTSIHIQYQQLLSNLTLDSIETDGTYSYQVTSVNNFGFESQLSEAMQVSNGDVVPPEPVILTATLSGANDVSLNWTGSASNDAAGYWLYRNDTLLQIINDVNTFEFVDTGLENGIYEYTVKVIDGVENLSEHSNVESITVMLEDLSIPQNLNVIAPNVGSSLLINWDPSQSPRFHHYNLYRSEVSGGPYTKIIEVSDNNYSDSPLQNNVEYFYVVTMLDEFNNESNNSDQVSGIPLNNLPATTPIITMPTVNGVPITLNTEHTNITGSAHPGDSIDLFINNVFQSTTNVGINYSSSSQAITSDNNLTSISGKGDWYTYRTGESLDEEFVIANISTPSELRISKRGINNSEWSQNATTIYLTYYDFVNDKTNLGSYNLALNETAVLLSENVIDSAVPSPNEDVIFYQGDYTDPQTGQSSSGIWLYNVINSVANEIVVPEDIYTRNNAIAWSSDGNTVAFHGGTGGKIYLYEISTQTLSMVDSSVGYSYSINWSPVDNMFIYDSTNRNGKLFTYDVDSGMLTELTSLGSSLQFASYSPNGNQIVYLQGCCQLYTYDLNTQLSTLVYNSNIQIDNLIWNENHGIVLVSGRQIIELSTPGEFNFSDAQLNPGTNEIKVVAREGDSLPQESLPIKIDFNPNIDLSVSENNFIIAPISALQNSQFSASVIINNFGSQSVSGAEVTAFLTSPDNNVESINITPNELDILAGGNQSLFFEIGTFNIVGEYSLTIIVDGGNNIIESDENNNSATQNFIVLENLNPTLMLSVSPQQLAPDLQAAISFSVFNPAQEFSGIVTLDINDENGHSVIDQQQFDIIELANNDEIDFSYNWQTTDLISGVYHITAQLKTTNGSLISEKQTQVEILAFAQFQLAMDALSNNIVVGENLEFSTWVDYIAGNTPQDVTLTWEIVDNTQQSIWSYVSVLSQVLPDFTTIINNHWQSQGAGDYELRLQFTADNYQHSLSLPFTVNPEQAQLAIQGEIANTSTNIILGQNLDISYTITNIGEINLDQTPITIKLLSNDLSNIIASYTSDLSLDINLSTELSTSLLTSGLTSSDNYLLALYADFSVYGGNMEQLLDTRSITAIDTTPPLITVSTPIANDLNPANLNLVFSVTDEYGQLDELYIQSDDINNGNRHDFNINNVNNIYQLEILNLLDGPHQINIFASDEYGNSIQNTLNFNVDANTPIIDISGVEDNAYYNQSVTTVVNITDDNLLSSDIQLNGNVIPANHQITDEGNYFLNVRAEDAVANVSTKSVNFTVDFTAPIINITFPENNTDIGQLTTSVTGYVNEKSLVDLSIGAYQDQVATSENGFFRFEGVPLQLGANSLNIQATDLASNASAITLDITGVNQSDITATLDNSSIFPVEQDLNLGYALINNTSNDFNALDVKIDLYNTANNQLIESEQETIDLLNAQSLNSSLLFTSSALVVGQYQAILSLFINGQWQQKSEISISLITSEFGIHVNLPLLGETYAADIITSVDLTNTYSVPPDVQYKLNASGAWASMVNTTGVNYIANLSLENGLHEISYRVNTPDNINSLETRVIFEIDTIAPVITVTNPVNGLITNQNVLLDYSATDNHSFDISALLSGINVSSGDTISDDGDYSLDITAIDSVNNQSSASVQFIIDKVNPTLTLSNLVANQQFVVNNIEITGTTEPSATVALDYATSHYQATANEFGDFSFSNVVLAEGDNNLVFIATDRASNQSSPLAITVHYESVDACTIFGFKNATAYNAFVFNDFTAQSSAVEGRLAVGNNINISRYKIGEQLTQETAGNVLIAGGDINFEHEQVYFGNILAAGDANIGQIVIDNMSPEATITSNAQLPINITESEHQLKLFSNALSELPENGANTIVNQELQLTGDCQTDLQVYDIDATELQQINNINYTCLAENAYLILNISGTNIQFDHVDLSHLYPVRQRTIWNFYQADSLVIHNIAIEGSILAVNALITGDEPLFKDGFETITQAQNKQAFVSGFINGQVMAQAYNSQHRINQQPLICSDSIQVDSTPIATDQNLSTSVNTPIAITLDAIDENLASLQYQQTSQVASGQLTGNMPNLTYTPETDFIGTVFFDYQVTDQFGKTSQARVTIEMIQPTNKSTDDLSILMKSISIIALSIISMAVNTLLWRRK